MRLFFYLPVITPWWFEAIVAPMLIRLNADPWVKEIHVMAAPLWGHTGVEGAQLEPLIAQEKLRWHIVDQGDPGLFRNHGAAVPGLIETVASIRPDLTLARSSDFVTPALFPGPVLYLMEAEASPFATDPLWVVLEKTPLSYGAMPDDWALPDDLAARMDALWAGAAGRFGPFSVPLSRPSLAVPLPCEHEENLFLRHAAHGDSVALLQSLLAGLPEEWRIEVCDHPLNRLHGDRSALEACVAAAPDRISMAEHGTEAMVAGASAVLTDLSRSWTLAAFAGKPMLHWGQRALAPWMKAGSDPAELTGPDRDAARRWFAWHLTARLLRPGAVDLNLLLRQAREQPTWEDMNANLDALEAMAP
ncbi:hypothetical protein [Novosphingobium sp. KACC 22771]|uniref:hypothetical protein n=1 Tax=Novosphingobium sp. KACC 22771 TaxID=3025670 RepID=UPI0023658351|nr:hypothetical protein [Novosphingobium sp. KACC 22771]WDF71700.1 hypothetical protein PQ467_12945 [Novosphingobium sp. KACC 22771]